MLFWCSSTVVGLLMYTFYLKKKWREFKCVIYRDLGEILTHTLEIFELQPIKGSNSSWYSSTAKSFLETLCCFSWTVNAFNSIIKKFILGWTPVQTPVKFPNNAAIWLESPRSLNFMINLLIISENFNNTNDSFIRAAFYTE